MNEMYSTLSCYTTQIKTFTASSGSQLVSIDNAFLVPIPESILIALVKYTAFVRSPSSNPFHFHHYDMTNLVLYVNGVQHPAKPLSKASPIPFRANRVYETLFSSIGTHHDYRVHMITWKYLLKDSTC